MNRKTFVAWQWFKPAAAGLSLALSMAFAPAQAQADEIRPHVLKLGHINDASHPATLGVQIFKQKVEEKSGGKMSIKEFGNSLLGNENQQQSALRAGTQDMLIAATASLSGIVPEFGMLDTPFIFDDVAHAYRVQDGPFGQALLARYEDKGVVGLEYFDLGFRNISNSKRPIESIDDIKGLKLRVIGNPLFVSVFEALGANPMPMAFSEVYMALENRAIDGQENPVATIHAAKLYEVQKYYTLSGHVYTNNLLQVSKKTWDKLNESEREVLRSAAHETLDEQRAISRRQGEELLGELVAKGMQVNELPAAERERMRLAVQPVVEASMAKYDPALVELFREQLAQAKNP